MPGVLPVDLAAECQLQLGHLDGMPQKAVAHSPLALQRDPLFPGAGVELLKP